MKERPILFSAQMVRAIIAERKTQTRRVVNPQPDAQHDGEPYWYVGGYRAWGFRPASAVPLRAGGIPLRCPYGQPGDRLWVKETTLKVEDHGYIGPVYAESDEGRACLSGGLAPSEDDCTEVEPWEIKRRPSIFMLRSMARILLEVVSVRVERLQDISDADARAEGINCHQFRPDDGFPLCDGYSHLPDDGECTLHPTAANAYRALWASINGAGSWDANPWVWVVEFKRVEA